MLPVHNLFEHNQDNNDHMYNHNIQPGINVHIIKKNDQRSGNRTYGTVTKVLTKVPKHTRGIKVKIHTGEVGRVIQIHK